MDARTASFPPTLFVVDDDAEARRGVFALAASLGIPFRGFGSAEQLLQEYHPEWAGCLLLDLRLPGLDGVALQQRLAAMGCALPVILISAHLDFPTAVRAMQDGALTVLEKPYPADQLTDAIRDGLRRDAQRRQDEARRRLAHERYASLSARERAVLQAVVRGTPVNVIARQLGLNARAVGKIRGDLFKKLAVDSLVALARIHAELEEAVVG